MKLYFSPGACSLIIRIALHELGLHSEYEAVDLKAKKTANGEDFLKINPKGVVPTLILSDNEVLTESGVILQYLADMNKATQLLPPSGDFKRYRILEWLNYISTELHKGFSPLFKPYFSQEQKDTIFLPAIKNKFDFIEKHLAQHKYLLGNTFTIVDMYLFVMLLWANRMQIELTSWPHLTNYYVELKTRKSIHQALTEEGL